MKKRFTGFFTHQLPDVMVSIVQSVIIGIALIILLFLSVTVVAFQWNQINRAYIPPVSAVPSTGSNSSSSSPNPQDEQILSEAQQDISIANNIITWSGFFLAFIATAVAIAGFFGIREFRYIRHLRSEFEKDIEEVRKLKAQVKVDLEQLNERFTNESQTFMDAAYNFGLATDAYKVGDNLRAIEYFLRVLQLQPKNVRVMERLGRVYSNLNEMQEAINYLEKAIEIDPSYESALRSLALCYRYTDKEKAIEKLKLALDINPSDYEALDFLGLIYRDNGQIDDAISAHEHALRLKRRPETQFYLSILYSKKGDRKRAMLMSLSAEENLHEREHDKRIRTVWKIIIHAGVYIQEDKEHEAYQLVETLVPYVTTQPIYNELTGHLKFFLEATGHKAWIPRFTSILKVKETQNASM